MPGRLFFGCTNDKDWLQNFAFADDKIFDMIFDNNCITFEVTWRKSLEWENVFENRYTKSVLA